MLIRMHLSSLRGLRITSFDLVTVGLAAQWVGEVVFSRPGELQRRVLYVHAAAEQLASAAEVIQSLLDPEQLTTGWISPSLEPAPHTPA
ncbi:hypothetical protein [Roseateles terrae]|uniref:Uncharacterized protein n=1 Tax=Roseateles terrae TaxID=431060 RepID=A0ABR6GUS3_9BURK|nr:hypothetical protein [Roseateles terrae]MBB3195417.1 hypothetical protein [Roseateles terrae]OWQ87396.1 hypothetical protein CDN98_11320 [Roseateles terrae]